MDSQAEALATYNIIGGVVGVLFILAFLAAIITLKGMALWRAARNGHKGWFIVMLFLNVIGILEVVYLLGPGKKAETPQPGMPPSVPPLPKP